MKTNQTFFQLSIKTRCQWRFLLKEYPPWKTVYSFYRRAKDRGWWEKMMRDLVQKSRIKMGRKPDPSYSLIDSQSVKTTDKAHERGIDGGEVKERKRHIVTDTQGLKSMLPIFMIVLQDVAYLKKH